MKKRIISLIVFTLLIIVSASGQNNTKKIDPTGTWKFDAPYAPEGYTSGIIIIGKAEQKHTATMSFTGSEYKLNGEEVKLENDTVTFSVYLEGEVIKVTIKSENEAKMVGKAVYSQGEVPLTLTKNIPAAK